MIEIKSINKLFGNKEIFKNYNLEINDGDFILITGHSGCGKTTLLNMIGSIEKPTSGDILVDGQSIYDKKYQLKYLREKVGFLFQNFALSDGDTVISNFKLVKKKSRTEMSYQKALSFVNLNDDVLKQKVYTLISLIEIETIDVYFEIKPKECGFKKIKTEDFKGSSHDKITLGIYRRFK